MKISEIIQNHLTNENLSQRQFAKMCGLSNGYISMLINNVNPKTGRPLIPSLSALMSLSQGLGVTLDELLCRADDIEVNIKKFKKIQTSSTEKELLEIFSSLSQEKQRQIIEYAKFLSQA